MSQPTRGDVHVNRPLTNMSIAYIQRQSDFIATQVFPEVPVDKQSDRYFSYDKQQWRRSDARKRAPGSESAGSGFNISNDNTFFCDVLALHTDIPDQVRGNQDSPINLDRDGTRFVTQQCLIKREQDFADNFFTTSLWTGSSTGSDITPGSGDEWNVSGSDPVQQVDAEIVAGKKKTGFRANTMVVSPDVHSALKTNAAILDRIKHTQRGVVTREILASLFEVDRYFVAEATEDTADEGATESGDYIFGGGQVLLCYANPEPSIMSPSAGYTFKWRLYSGSVNGTRIKRFRMEKLESDRIECEMAYDQKVIGADLGIFFDGVLAA